MNIIVKPMEGLCTCRPDTTWERENKDIYAIPAVEGYRFTPVLFVRVSKAGKCIGYKFADRYYDGFNFGVLLYGGIRPGAAVDGNAQETETVDASSAKSELTWSACLDHSSILPFPLYNPLVLDNDENEFVLRKNGKVIFSTVEGSREMVENAIAEVSEVVSLRIGDIVAVELQEPLLLVERIPEENAEQDCLLTGDFLETETFRHQIYF